MEEEIKNEELTEQEKELAEKPGKAYMMLFTKKGIKHFEENIDKIFIGVKFIRTIEYDKAKEDAKGITDNRQVLVYDKTFNTYGILSLYGLSINFVIKDNPNNFILYKLW